MPSRNRKKRSKQRRPLYVTATTQILNLSNLLNGSDIKRTSTAHTASSSSSSRSSRSTATVLAPPAWLPWPEPGCRGQRRGLGRGRRQARGTVQYIKYNFLTSLPSKIKMNLTTFKDALLRQGKKLMKQVNKNIL